jgi:glycerol uptake facilitator-like aquaporin
LARSLTDTFSGIRPVDLPGFWIAEIIGAVAALLLFTWLLQPGTSSTLSSEAKL